MLYVHAIKIHKLVLSLKNVIRREVTDLTDVDQNGEKVVFIASMAVIDALCKAKYSPLSCLSVCLSVCIPSYLSVCPSVPLHAS